MQNRFLSVLLTLGATASALAFGVYSSIDCPGGVKIYLVSETSVCFETESEYLKSRDALFAKKSENAQLDISEWQLYIAFLDHEIKEKGSITISQATTENINQKIETAIFTP